MHVAAYGHERSASRAASATASSSGSPTRRSSSGSWRRPARRPPRGAATPTRSSASSARRATSAPTSPTRASRCAGSRRWSRTTSWTMIERYGFDSEIPAALTDYVKARKFYDYKDTAASAPSTAMFVTTRSVDRFCVLGDGRAGDGQAEGARVDRRRPVQHLPDDEGQDETLAAYGKEIIPRSAASRLRARSQEREARRVPGINPRQTASALR